MFILTVFKGRFYYLLKAILVKYMQSPNNIKAHEDFMTRKHYPYNWSRVTGILRSPVDSSHKGSAMLTCDISVFIFSLTKMLIKNCVTGSCRRHDAHDSMTSL